MNDEKELSTVLNAPDNPRAADLLSGHIPRGMQSVLSQLPEPGEICIYEKDMPNSVVNKLPETLAKYVRELPEELHFWDEAEARQHVRPTITLERARCSFWSEYHDAIVNKKQMSIRAIARGVMSRQALENGIFQNPRSLAFVLIPPADYQIMLKEMHMAALEEVRKIFLIPEKNKAGEHNIKAAELKLKAAMWLSDLVWGPPIQHMKVQQDTRSVSLQKHEHQHTHKQMQPPPQNAQATLDRIRELEKELKTDILPPESDKQFLKAAETVKTEKAHGRGGKGSSFTS